MKYGRFFLRSLIRRIFFLTLFLPVSGALSQPFPPGQLPSRKYDLHLDAYDIHIGSLDIESIHDSDQRASISGEPYRFAAMIPVDIHPATSGRWVWIPGEGKLWHLTLTADEAIALAPYFDSFHIPQGAELFVYNQASSHIAGPYTFNSTSHHEEFATEFIRGSSITFEYFEPLHTSGSLEMHISDIAFAYRGIGSDQVSSTRGFGDSGDCEVNCTCSEGNSWRDEINGVVRIAVRNGSSVFWCTGALVNNTVQDFEPYILTADHCAFYSGQYVSESDLNQWIFYFNYESLTCENPPAEPAIRALIGATLLAQGGNTGNTGSDFYLVRLKNKVPGNYNPYFLGWDRENALSSNGVALHHPQGDIKKISTYTQPTISSQWNGNGLQSHWRVYWSETENGHGVTEGGSSGSPLLNSFGMIIGTLTGGDASCANTGGPDYFGKFSYHWESNGPDDASRLSPWLDPENSGTVKLQGTYYSNITEAAFAADTTSVPVNGRIDFVDLSAGRPTEWEWIFEGGEPSSSTQQNPQGIQYHGYGVYDVQLIIQNEISTDTLLRRDYIRVEPVFSPNPSTGQVKLFTGEGKVSSERVSICNTMGQQVGFRVIETGETYLLIDLSERPNGTYLVRLQSDTYSFSGKISILRP